MGLDNNRLCRWDLRDAKGKVAESPVVNYQVWADLSVCGGGGDSCMLKANKSMEARALFSFYCLLQSQLKGVTYNREDQSERNDHICINICVCVSTDGIPCC